MFNLEEFKDNVILESIVGNLNKYLSKNKVEKVLKLVEELKDLLDEAGVAFPFISKFLSFKAMIKSNK